MNIFSKKNIRLLKIKFLIFSAICSALTFNLNRTAAITGSSLPNEERNITRLQLNAKKTEIDAKKSETKEKEKTKSKNNEEDSKEEDNIEKKKKSANSKNKKNSKSKEIKEPTHKYIEEKELTTDRLLIKLIRKGLSDKDILNFYFNMSEKKIGKIISNDWTAMNEEKEPINMTDKEKETLKNLISKIQKREIKYLKKKIPLPSNPEKPIVVLTPGFGYEDPGAIREINGKEIESAKLNANAVYYLTKSLLNQGFEVYIPSDLEYAGLELPKDDPACHVIYDGRPPLRGPGDKTRIADAYHIIIKTIFNKLIEDDEKRNTKKKMCSICIHHNTNPDGKVFGFVPYYENTEKTSKKFTRLSKKLANIFDKYGNGISPDRKGIDVSKVIEEDWVFCHFGGVNEKELKEFNSQAAVMLEREFMSNKTQLRKLLKVGYMKKTAMNFTKAICKYFGKQYKKTKEDEKIDSIVRKLKKNERKVKKINKIKSMENKAIKKKEYKRKKRLI